MGLFSRKAREGRPVVQQEVQQEPVGWLLAPDEGIERLTSVDQAVIEAILEASGDPNRKQRVTVAISAAGEMSIAAYWQGQLVGHADGLSAGPYVPGLKFLGDTNRYGIVSMDVPSRKSKYFGTAELRMPWAGRGFVPFNQPPPGYEVHLRIYSTVKNERFHASDIDRLSPASGTPGWFLLEPQPDGEILVYAPEYGRPGLGIEVGAIVKAELAETLEALGGQTAAVFGRVIRTSGLDIQLGF